MLNTKGNIYIGMNCIPFRIFFMLPKSKYSMACLHVIDFENYWISTGYQIWKIILRHAGIAPLNLFVIHDIKLSFLISLSKVVPFSFFSGGVPDPEIMTVNRYSQSLQGCIKEIFIQNQGPLNLGLEAIGGLNVEPCNSLNFKWSMVNSSKIMSVS